MNVQVSRKAILPVMTIAFAIMVWAAPRASAQDGSCCSQTMEQQVRCKQLGCSANMTYTKCTNPDPPNAQIWHVRNVQCCSEQYTSFVVQTPQVCGGGTVSQLASTAKAAVETTLYAEGIWVRTCTGKYILTVRPVTG